MNEPAGRTTRLARLTRWLGLDRNPLRRRSDRAETAIMAALLAAFLIGAPITAIAASHVARAATLRAQQTPEGSHRVSAVVLDNAPKDASFMYQSATFAWVRARWTAANGTAHVGEVLVASGTRAGSKVRVWVDSSGRVTTAPLTAGQMLDRMVAAVVLAPIVLAVLLLSLGALARRLIDHRRLTGWHAGWEAIEPQWTHRV